MKEFFVRSLFSGQYARYYLMPSFYNELKYVFKNNVIIRPLDVIIYRKAAEIQKRKGFE